MSILNQAPHTEQHALIPHHSASRLVRQPFYDQGGPRYGFESQEDGETDFGLLAYWQILKRHKTTVLLAALFGTIAGFLIGVPMKPVYQAKTSLEVLNLNQDFMDMKRSSPVTTNDNSYDTSEEETQAKLLQGDALIKRVAAKLDPNSPPAQPSGRMASSGWRAWLHLPEHVELTPRQKLLAAAADSLNVRATPRTRILEVTVNSNSAQFASDFANTLVQEFVSQNLEARFNSTQRTSEWLKREIDDARARLQTSEDALQAYARESGLIFTDENTNVATEKLQQQQDQLSKASADRIGKQARYELSKSSPPDSLPDVVGDDHLQETHAKLTDLYQRVASMEAVFNPGYTKLQEAKAELVSVQAAYEHDRDHVIDRIRSDYEQALANEKLLAVAYVAQTREVSGQSEKGIQYNILKREVDSNRQLYDTMLQQTKQASIASAMRASNVRVVDPASVPNIPISPNFKLNAALGMFAGLFLSIGLVTLRERADKTFQKPGDIKLWADLPELGTIPDAGLNLSGAYVDRSVLANGTHHRGLDPAAPSASVELMTWRHKPSFVAEAVRSSLTSILSVGENGNRPRILVFTSANPSDGKSTVVSNLAIATAEIRLKVLVIDADLRRPRMHNIFSLPNDRGLSDLLTEEYSDKTVASLIQKTAIPGLDVITCGPATQFASHLLYSPNLSATLTLLKNQYDMILIDTPPASHMTDARVVGRLADAVVLVARAGQTMRDALIAVKDRLAEDGIPILGTVLNGWDPKRSPSGYYGGKHYSYRYAKYSQN